MEIVLWDARESKRRGKKMGEDEEVIAPMEIVPQRNNIGWWRIRRLKQKKKGAREQKKKNWITFQTGINHANNTEEII